MLTEATVRATDSRAQFVGIDAYVEAGGVVLRDLFEADDGGWLQDPVLLDRMVADKLRARAEDVAAEGWKWIDVDADFPYGHTYGLRRCIGDPVPLTDEEARAPATLEAEFDDLEAEHGEADELPEEVDRRLGEIETALEAFEERPMIFDPDEIARAGAFVSIDARRASARRSRLSSGPRTSVRPSRGGRAVGGEATATRLVLRRRPTTIPRRCLVVSGRRADEDDGLRPMPDRLLTELTAHRTLALRDALAATPTSRSSRRFTRSVSGSSTATASTPASRSTSRSAGFGAQAPGLADTSRPRRSTARHETWRQSLPKEPEQLWDVLAGFDGDSRQALLRALRLAVGQRRVRGLQPRPARARARRPSSPARVGLDMASRVAPDRRRATSVASPRPASLRRCARRRASGGPSSSTT